MVHGARAFGYELVSFRDGETSVVSIRHSPFSPAGLKSAVVLALLVALCWLLTESALDSPAPGSPDAVFRVTVVVAFALSVLVVQVPKRLMLLFGSQSVRASQGQVRVEQDCVIWKRAVVLELQAGYVASADRGWIRRYWEESVGTRPGVIGGLAVFGANGVEVARFGIGISRRAAERLCGGGLIQLFGAT